MKSEVEHAPYTYPQADAEIDSRGHQKCPPDFLICMWQYRLRLVCACVCVCVCVCIGGKYTEGLVPIKPERNRDTELLPLTD